MVKLATIVTTYSSSDLNYLVILVMALETYIYMPQKLSGRPAFKVEVCFVYVLCLEYASTIRPPLLVVKILKQP